MKKIINKSVHLLIIALAHLLISSSIFAQAPQKMSYQAVIRNTSGALVTSTSVGMKISILQGTATGNVAYSETQIASTNANGLVSLEIGAGTVVSGTFAGINWSTGPYFIKTETDPLGGTNYSITGTNELMSVPYALFSANGTPGPQGVAGTPGNDGATGAQGIQGPAGTFPPGTVPGEMNYWNGTAWVTVPPGISISGAPLTLRFCNGVPTWGSAYGNPCAAFLPTVTTTVDYITSCSASGECITASGFGLQSWGICWSTSPNPTVDNSNVGYYYIENLVPNTTYYVRAYAINSVGIAYGNQVSFTTLSVEIITTAVSEISGCTALSGGQSNLCNVNSSGVCWSTTTNPTKANSHTQDGGSPFTSSITGLAPNTSYYVRAYVTANNGLTYYGNQVSFTTAFPGLITTAVSEITGCSALSGGMSSMCDVSSLGVCWSTSANPTTADNVTQDWGSPFTSNIYGLVPNTTYYVRAYATNGNEVTSYGNQVSFTTTAFPSLVTTAVSEITGCSALSGGQSNNLCDVSSLGVCWSISANPTTADNVTQDWGSSFTSSITGLAPNTTYYVRAYASYYNGQTSYGNQVSFSTMSSGTVSTAVSENTGCTALISGLSAICEASTVGVCWNTSPNPTLINFALQTQYVALSFNIFINSLIGNTTYYARAYATNENGQTYYGNQVSFTTGSLCIGQSYEGGILAYILQAGDPGYNASVPHGLIAAPSDQGVAPWGCQDTEISGADGTAIGTGAQNTLDIMNGCSTAGIAARLCGDLVMGGYSDWYLPSKDELNKLYINRFAIGGFADNYYWSSTENDGDYAWRQNVYYGNQYNGSKDVFYTVRAVRAF